MSDLSFQDDIIELHRVRQYLPVGRPKKKEEIIDHSDTKNIKHSFFFFTENHIRTMTPHEISFNWDLLKVHAAKYKRILGALSQCLKYAKDLKEWRDVIVAQASKKPLPPANKT